MTNLNPITWLCAVSGHDYHRHGLYLVCHYCGHRVKVGE